MTKTPLYISREEYKELSATVARLYDQVVRIAEFQCKDCGGHSLCRACSMEELAGEGE